VLSEFGTARSMIKLFFVSRTKTTAAAAAAVMKPLHNCV
jgi:hypothetical protein